MAQRATSVKKSCYKCKNNIDNKQFTTCSICNDNYHIDCANVSFARFKIWTSENKKSWKCTKCIDKSQNSKLSTTILGQENVTIRQVLRTKVLRNTNKEKSPPLTNIKDICKKTTSPPALTPGSQDATQRLISRSLSMELPGDSLNSTFQSLEDLSKSSECLNDLDIVKDMKRNINKLKINLESTENELENTIIENNGLKREIDKLSQEIRLLKSICKSPKKITKVVGAYRVLFVSQVQDQINPNK